MKTYYIFCSLLLFIFISCEDEIVTPPEKNYGIQGRVLDENGNAIDGADIYCLFNYSYLPTQEFIVFPSNNTQVDSFGNALFQNFPNPVYNSSFARYSLADDMDVELTVKDNSTGNIRYTFSEFQNYGLYQHHLNEIVSSLQLENGAYNISLKISNNSEVKYKSEKTMFVVSDIGKPNTVSDKQGKYLFNYNDACIGDTIVVTSDGSNLYPEIISNEINLLFEKEGYIPVLINADLYSGILLTRDVILQKEELK